MPTPQRLLPPNPALLMLILPLAALLAPGAMAQSHAFKDWAIACDNTRHCEAVGYQAESSDGEAVAMQLLRNAGPNSALQIRLTWDEENAAGQPATLKIGSLVLGSIKPEQALFDSQVRQLLPALLKADKAILTTGKSQRTLSLAGLNAALLKMDDLQGRIDTPGALVRKGSKPEGSVLPPLPLPTVRIAALPAGKSDDEKLLKAIFRSVKDRSCFDDMTDAEKPQTLLQAISATQVLVMRECGRGAYQGSSTLWLANIKPPHAPQVVMLPTPFGKPTDSVMNADFDKGRLNSWSKGRGINDCGEGMAWGWNGKQFELISASNAPLCRGLPMGGFALQTWQAKVLP